VIRNLHIFVLLHREIGCRAIPIIKVCVLADEMQIGLMWREGAFGCFWAFNNCDTTWRRSARKMALMTLQPP
jgi:hypothetical protein